MILHHSKLSLRWCKCSLCKLHEYEWREWAGNTTRTRGIQQLLEMFNIWGVSRKLTTFVKMTVIGMYLRDLNALVLHYPFMSNPRYCLGCATTKKDLRSFIFLLLLFLCPVHNPFLPILRQPAVKAQLSSFSIKNEGPIPLMPISHLSWPSPCAGPASILVIQYFRSCAMSSRHGTRSKILDD